MTIKSNRLIIFILGLIASLYILIRSIYLITNDVNIDLNKSTTIVGPVAYTDIRKIEVLSFTRPHFISVFYFELSNSIQKFTVHNSYEGYIDLQSNIKIGDTIKVYYASALLGHYNRHVFQIEKGGNILVDYADFNRSASEKAGLSFFIGIIVLVGLIMWFKRFNIFKFLDRLVKI